MEAMACELPSVASNTCGINELIIPNETGILVPVENPQALADGIISLLKNPEQRASMGGKAREYVSQNLTFKKIAEEYVELYKALLK
jgi:glycosyltransferase involved in cell wall biosynthesis